MANPPPKTLARRATRESKTGQHYSKDGWTIASSQSRIKRGPGQRMVDGKSFGLADEVRYIQRRLPSTTAAS
jgi:hypothetical protein